MAAKIQFWGAFYVLDIYGSDLNAAPVYRAYFDTIAAARSAADSLGARVVSFEGV